MFPRICSILFFLTVLNPAFSQRVSSPEVQADRRVIFRLAWVPTPGQHSFRVWRRYLAEFVPLLFQEQKKDASR